MAGRRTSLASLAGAAVETVPGQNDPTLVRIPLAKVAPTPLNPRTDFGGADALAELGESMRRRQLQPVVVVSRVSYLKLFPEHTEQVGQAAYVIITGERRYRGARQVDLPTIGAIILEEIATSRADVLDAVLSENIDRKNFNPIEEALAVHAMVKECGTSAAVAEKFRRTPGWVSQRLALLKLAPEVQVLVRSGQIPVRDARGLAGHPADEQLPAWQRIVSERAEERLRKSKVEAPAPRGDVGPARQVPAGEQHGTERAVPEPMPGELRSTDHVSAPPPQRTQTPAPGRPVEAPASREPENRRPALPRVPWPEPDWAVGDDSAPVQAARSLVDRFVLEDRRRIQEYLASVAAAEEAVAADA